MAKLQLTASPTFKAKVPIPVAGIAKPVEIEFTFKHKNRTDYQAFIESLGAFEDDTAMILEIASGWELEDAYTAENVRRLTEQHIGSALAVLNKYIAEQSGAAKVKNF